MATEKHTLSIFILAVVLWPCAAGAQTVYRDPAAFKAAISEQVIQGFESFSTEECSYGGKAPAASIASESFVITTQSLDGGKPFLCIGTASGGPTPTNGANALVAGSNDYDRWVLTIATTAKKPIFAVGFYLTDAAEWGDALFSLGTEEQGITIAGCCQPSGSKQFFGYVSQTPFTAFKLWNLAKQDGWAIDDITLAGAPPKKKSK